MEEWEALRLEDTIRFVRMPSFLREIDARDNDWGETVSLYRRLISERIVLPITRIDDDGRPWIEYQSTDRDGLVTSHALAVDDDSWERSL